MPTSFFQQAFHLLFPEPCIHCGNIQSDPLLLCNECLEELPKTLHRIQKPELIQLLWGLAEYSGPVGSLIRRCKYKPDIHIFQGLIARMELSKIPWESFDAITHIPTTHRRIFTRGFDQAQILAQLLSKSVSIPYFPMLKRIDRYPQSLRTHIERKQNLSRRFQFTASITPTNILIVDDVCTTGNTMEAAAMTLLNNGIHQAYGLVVGYSY
ncbi:MAG: hypothetical protein CL916_11690 [Deltaproteobacteria bacterium]|nr:hypothetical protein [Deltaproteobacteria bacterium]